MTKRIVIATAPDGTVLPRQTDNAYVAAVLIEVTNSSIYATAERYVSMYERSIAQLEAMTPDHDQFRCRDHNLQVNRKRLADAQAHLATLSPEGTTWRSYSFHKTEAAAHKAVGKVYNADGSYVRIIVAPVTAR